MRFSDYINEEKEFFMGGYVTHNKKFKIKMVRVGKSMTGNFSMYITSDGKTIKKDFPTEREMTAHWKKLHKANLK